MTPNHIQRVLAAAGLYRGTIDGRIGPKTMAAVAGAEDRLVAKYGVEPIGLSDQRRQVAAVQACLNTLGFEPGPVDGWEGHNTREALSAFIQLVENGRREIVDRKALPVQPGADYLPRQREVPSYYGQPGSDSLKRQLTTIQLPFRLRIDWNLSQSTNRITVHEKAAPSLKAALIAVHAHYGQDRMRTLGIDRYAGAYNHRKMRGGSKWSMHAYGCAIDFFAAPNGLRMRCPEALFCGPDYKDFLDIMESFGWLPALRLWGADAMHFQRARL